MGRTAVTSGVKKVVNAAEKAGQDEDLEWGKWGKDKKAAGAKKFAELKAAAAKKGSKKFAELKAAVEKAAAAKKGSNQDEDLEWGKWGKDKKAAGAKKFAELKAAAAAAKNAAKKRKW